LIGIIVVGVLFLYHFLRRPVPTGDPEELPIIGHQVATHIESASSHKPPPASTDENRGANAPARGRESLGQNALRPGSP
jgi:hypothetical protein